MSALKAKLEQKANKIVNEGRIQLLLGNERNICPVDKVQVTGYYAHLRLHLLLCNFSTSLIFIICLLERDFCAPEHIGILDKFPFVSFKCVSSHSLKFPPTPRKENVK